MTIFTETPRVPTNATFAGGIASLADIGGAAWDSLKYVENANGAYQSLYEAIERRRSTIHGATGAQLANPLAEAEEEWRRLQTERPQSPFSTTPRETRDQIYNRHLDAFRAELAGLSEKFPDSREAIGADRDPWDDAAGIARAADTRLGTLMASRSGLGKYGALLAGGMAGALADPLTLMSLAAGGGPGAARTFAGRVLTVAGKEALINAATEAAVQPMVQDWRRRAGLEAGTDEAIRNVLFAGAIGGAFGAAGGAAAEIIGRQIGSRQSAVENAAAVLPPDRLSEPARSILADDGLKAADSLAEIRAALAPEARGALDAAETIRIADEARPPSASPARHDMALAEADRAVRTGDVDAWPGFQPDPAQVERVVNEIAGRSAVGSRQSGETSLIDFLIDRGGVKDFQGELAAIGAGDVAERFRGRLVKDSGAPLDTAREAAAEAGYFDHLYGTADEAAAKSTVADLLAVLEEDIRARTSGTTPGADAALAGLESTVAEIARMAGPGVDDAVLARAARMSVEDGMEPFDALERVLIAEDAPPAAVVARTGEPMPGWSDAELLAASEHRGAWPEPDGLDDPRALDPDDAGLRDFADLPDDFEIPTETGVMRVGALREQLERAENLYRVVEACRA